MSAESLSCLLSGPYGPGMSTHGTLQLARRPAALPSPDDFEIVEKPLDEPDSGQLLVENLWLSVDPYHREIVHYGPLHTPFEGRALGRVVASGRADVEPGTVVLHRQGLRTHALVDQFRTVTPARGVPLSAYLGILGGTGLTAWVGLTRIAELQPGESILITAAGGAVGTAAGHIARALGAGRVIGVTGARAKAERLLTGPFDDVVVYREVDLRDALTGLAVDVALEGVGGTQLEAVIDAMTDRGRIALVGAIGQYNNLDDPPPAPRNLFDVVEKQLRIEGYLVRDHMDQREPYEEFMTPLVETGTVPVEETVATGLEGTAQALIDVLTGQNFGKQLVELT